MADNQSRELTVKVNVDVSEALTGLKALQREAKEATKALRELEEQTLGKRYNGDVIALLASRVEGATFANMRPVYTEQNRLNSDIERLRREGFRIILDSQL